MSILCHLTLCSPIASVFMQVVGFILFYGWIIFHLVYYHLFFLLHLFMDNLSVVSRAAIYNLGASLCYKMFMSGYIPSSGIAGSYGKSIFLLLFFFFKKSPYCFPQACSNLHCHQQNSSFCTSMPAIVSPHPLHFSQSNRNEVIEPSGFNLHYPNELWCWEFFQLSIGHF